MALVNGTLQCVAALEAGPRFELNGQEGTHLGNHGPGRFVSSGVSAAKGYQVHGIVRRASTFNTERLDPIYADPHEQSAR